MRAKHVVIAFLLAGFFALISLVVVDTILQVVAPALRVSPEGGIVVLGVVVVVLILSFIILLFRMRGLEDYERTQERRKVKEAEEFVSGS